MDSELLISKDCELRLMEESDIANRVQYINDVGLQKYLNFDFPTSYEKTKDWFFKSLMNRGRVDFSIVDTHSREVIGFCGFVSIDRVARKAELYIFIGGEFSRGKGIGRQTYVLLTNYGFDELGMERLYLYQHVDNIAAIKSSERAGWLKEGKLRMDLFSHGQYHDHYIYSILRKEWSSQ